ncbi:yersiniabactin polyketide/non-ribosomal peptide synthetase, partial [Pseudomonas savastanoi pv. glycinea str. race 4]
PGLLRQWLAMLCQQGHLQQDGQHYLTLPAQPVKPLAKRFLSPSGARRWARIWKPVSNSTQNCCAVIVRR